MRIALVVLCLLVPHWILAENPLPTNRPLVKKDIKLQGSISIEKKNGKHFVVFSDDFKTRSGPDLKVLLSTTELAGLNGKNATNEAINLGPLKNNKGGQSYEIPSHVKLEAMKSVLVHCVAYAKLWGDADLY